MSLQEQLKRIGTADLRNVTEVSRKHKASFLFSSREAADQDLDTIYSIAYNGILELVNLDSGFEAFEKTLFSEQMKSFDRVLKTPEENAKLDASISAFLKQLSPYFLLKPAGKALEWLLRRFNVHQFNVEALISCALPYHETKSFVKIVSLVEIAETSPWAFLLPIKKSNIHLERPLLVKQMYKNRYILEFICKMATEATVKFSTLYSFYTAAVIDYLKYPRVIKEEMTIAIMPYIMHGLSAKDNGELQVATYMIVSQLVAKASLNGQALINMTHAMIKHCNKSCFHFCLLTIVHLAQAQKSYAGLGPKSSKRLIENASFDKSLLAITKKFTSDRFMASIIPALRDAVITKGKADLINQLILEGLLSHDNIQLFCHATIDGYLALGSDADEDREAKSKYIEAFRCLLVTISQRYVDDLDAVLNQKLKEASSESDSQSDALYEFTSEAFKGTRHQIVKEANTTLFLCLNSPAVSTRLLAMKQLVNVMSDETNPLAQTPDVIEHAFLECLDDFNELLLYVISDIPKQLLASVPAEKILNALSILLERQGAADKKESSAIMVFLLSEFLQQYPDMQKRVASLLAVFVFSGSSAAVQKLAKKTEMLSYKNLLGSVLANVRTAVKSADHKNPTSICRKFVILEAEALAKSKNEERLSLWVDMAGGVSTAEKLMTQLVFNNAVSHAESMHQYKLVSIGTSAIFASLAEKDKAVLYSTALEKPLVDASSGLPDDKVLGQIRSTHVISQRLVVNMYQSTFGYLIEALPCLAEPVNWFSTNNADHVESYSSTVKQLYLLFVSGPRLGAFESLVATLISKHLKDRVLPFLISMWTNNGVTTAVRARSLQIAASYLRQYTLDNADLIDFQHLVPSLLPALSDDDRLVRMQALDCFTSINTIYSRMGLPSGHKIYATDRAVNGISKTKPTTSTTIMTAEAVYGCKTGVANIRANDASHLVDYLHYRNKEITEDKHFIKLLLSDLVRLSSESSDKQIQSRKNHILDLLLDHVNAAPTDDIRIKLLSLLDQLDSPHKLGKMMPLLKTMVTKPTGEKDTELIRLLVRCYLPSNAHQLGTKSDEALPLFLRLLSNQKALKGEDEDGWQLSTRRLALQQITPAFYENGSEKMKRELFSALIDVATNGRQNEVRLAKSVLVVIDTPAKLYDAILTAFAKSLMLSTTGEEVTRTLAKRSRPEQNADSNHAPDLYELVTVLELLESRAIEGDVELVKPLFEVQTALINADLRDTSVSLEYISQLVMSSLTRIIQSAEENGVHVDETALRVDIIVQCIRTSGNPQTHNQALLLMASIASIYPESVLHNVMAIFTFMGANVLRQDDNYSFQVIQKTLEKIIPPLVSFNHQAAQTTEALALQVKPIIKVFVGALFHIPEHRRLGLFTVLVRTLDEDKFLYAIISLLLEKFVSKVIKGNQEDSEPLMNFCLSISHQFSPQTQMYAVMSLLNSLLVLPNIKSADAVMEGDTLFDVNEHNDKELRRFKLATLQYVENLLSSNGFLANIMEQVSADDMFEATMQPLYLSAIETLLKIVANVSQFVEYYAVTKDAVASVSKFWRNLLKTVYDVLNKVNNLLPLPAFANAVVHLMKHDNVQIRRRAMNLFVEKVNGIEDGVSEEEEVALINVVPEFANAIINESNSATDEDSIINKQSALMCITSLAKLSGNVYPAQFVDVIPTVIGPNALQLASAQLKISSLTCLTVICQQVGPRSVPHLPKFMPLILDILMSTVQAEKPNVMLQLAATTCLGAIVDSLPHFVSPYLPKMLAGLLHPSIYAYSTSDSQKTMSHNKVVSVLSQMATMIPSRVLFTPVFAYLDKAVKSGEKPLLALYTVVSNAIHTMTRDVMTAHYKQLFKFFLLAFDLRRAHKADFSDKELATLESSIISAFLDFVMKLNETLFKPLFLKIVDWATVEIAESDAEGTSDRVLFFYKLVGALLDRLKTIFTPYYGYLVDDVITRLQGYVAGETEPDLLWNYLMESLQRSFLYDSDNLWNAAKFTKILDPVVDQMLVTGSDETSDQYLSRMSTYLAPCIGQMAVTVSNDTLWKPLNHKILMKTREDSPEIRLVAIKCIETLYERLGEEWLLFLAESISFLAELMEDDDRRVEKAVQKVNALIETFLGESLDTYFNKV